MQNQSAEAQDKAGFDFWALLELFGHSQIVGHLTQVSIGGDAMLRVDVPTGDGEGVAFTRFYNPKAVYSMSPIDKEIALELVRATGGTAPVQPYGVPQLTARITEQVTISRRPAIRDTHSEPEGVCVRCERPMDHCTCALFNPGDGGA